MLMGKPMTEILDNAKNRAIQPNYLMLAHSHRPRLGKFGSQFRVPRSLTSGPVPNGIGSAGFRRPSKLNGSFVLAHDPTLTFWRNLSNRSVANDSPCSSVAGEFVPTTLPVRRLRQVYTQCYNILEGFGGKVDNNGQRGRLNGWRFSELPWRS
jgi:hypothetical protein